MSKLKGRNLVVFYGTGNDIEDCDAVGLATSCTIDISRDVVEATNPLSGKSKTFLAGRYSWTVSTDGLVDVDGSVAEDMLYNFDTKLTLFIGSARVSSGQLVPAGDGFALKGDAYITSINMTASEDGYAKYSVTFQGTGDISFIPY